MRRAALSCLALIVPASVALAGSIETEATRYTLAANQGGIVTDGPNQHDAPTLYGMFEDINETFAWDEFHGGSSQAYQLSTISPGIYSIYLASRTDAGGGTMGTEIATGYAESFCEVKFTLTEATDFTVAGSYNAFGEINGAISVSEIRIDSFGGGTPSQIIARTTNDCCPQVNVSGTLLPGDYALRAVALAIVDHSFMTSYTESNAEANFTMTLDIEAPVQLGDMNCSGAVNAEDIAPFVQSLIDPAGYVEMHENCDINLADINGDTVRDGSDIADFVACVLALGCP